MIFLALGILLSGCVHQSLGLSRRKDAATLGPNFESRQLSHQQKTREYLLYTPQKYDVSTPMPLVIGFHGGKTSNVMFAKSSLFHHLADEQGFLVAYPNAIDGNWNDGRGTANPDVDDVGFVTSLIENIKNIRNVDPRRIYVTGISNGGFMVQRLACESSHLIAAFSSVAGSMGTSLRPKCNPSQPVSMMLIHSPQDNFVPWRGGEMKRGAGGNILSVPDLVEFWNQKNSCTVMKEVPLPDNGQKDNTRVTVSRYGGCKDSSEVLLYKIDGGGHTWPGGEGQPAWLVGPTSMKINATKESWIFFKSHSLQ
ncbi:hydrolase [bacterium]|nr:hydrolase [bacterium]